MEWEWKVIHVSHETTIEHKLNDLAKERWQVESILPPVPGTFREGFYTVFLKRKTKERIDED